MVVFRLVTSECVLEGKAGDIIWIPKGTELKYEGTEARIFYAVYPGNLESNSWYGLSCLICTCLI